MSFRTMVKLNLPPVTYILLVSLQLLYKLSEADNLSSTESTKVSTLSTVKFKSTTEDTKVQNTSNDATITSTFIPNETGSGDETTTAFQIQTSTNFRNDDNVSKK